MDVERLEGEVISLCGAGGVCEVMKTGLLLAGLTINFNQRAPLAGLVTPCVTVWDRSGSIFKYVTLQVLLGLEPGSSANKVGQLFFFFFSFSGGWGKIKLKLTTLPRIFIRVVCTRSLSTVVISLRQWIV